ncbi:MAG TPA: hypothetical protein VFT70_17000 [Nocardioides sp.]|nr:hypothetical protein [Nocardioides sp.]
MSKDAASSTPKPARKPAQKSMITREGGSGGQEPSGSGQPSRSERAQEMRAALGVRQEAEALLAEASQLRQRAAADADAMVADAETLASELVEEASSRSEQLVAEAQERADGIVARARAEADELEEKTESERERLRAEVTAALEAEVAAERDRVAAVLGQARAALRELAPLLTAAGTTVGEVVGSLDLLAGDAPGDASGDVTGDATGALEDAPGVETAPMPAGPQEVAAPAADAPAGENPEDARPLGWLFRNSQG